MAEETQETQLAEAPAEANNNRELIALGSEKATLESFMRARGITFDATKSVMKQLKEHIALQHDGSDGQPKWSNKKVTAEAERIMYREWRPFVDAVIAHITRNYDLQLPKFSKRRVDDDDPESSFKSGSIPFVAKKGKVVGRNALADLIASGDPTVEAALTKAGFILKDDRPALEIKANV